MTPSAETIGMVREVTETTWRVAWNQGHGRALDAALAIVTRASHAQSLHPVSTVMALEAVRAELAALRAAVVAEGHRPEGRGGG